MKTVKVLFFMMLFFFLNNMELFAQSIWDIGKPTPKPVKIISPQPERPKTKEFAYYAEVVKKNGWWTGVGNKLSKESASHLGCYYKLSNKNSAGYWTQLEALDGFGKPTTSHSIKTYLINSNNEHDMFANSDWKDKIKTVCKWVFIGDETGKNVVQERALNENNEIVFCFNPVKISENEFTGSFVDSWGMPIYMRTDTLGNDLGYANFVHITRDNRGFEVLFAFTDRNGNPQKNKDGAYMTRKEYDDNGHQIKEQSLNIVGDLMIDDFGNCGWEATYKNDRQLEARFYDAEWKPIRMPDVHGDGSRVYGYRFHYDNYGRQDTIYIIGKNGLADANQYGVHKMANMYDIHGQQTSVTYYDINNNLCANDSLGLAQLILDIDNKGVIHAIKYKGIDGHYINHNDGWCMDTIIWKNDKKVGDYKYYVKKNNRSKLYKFYEFTTDDFGNTKKIWYKDNQVRIDSVDDKGRKILTTWYTLDGKPTVYDSWHKKLISYDDLNNIKTEECLDKKGEPYVDLTKSLANKYSKSVNYSDSVNHIVTNYQYINKVLMQSFQKQFSPDFEDIVAQWDITPYGEHARVGWWNNLHYTCKVDYTMYGEIRSMVGQNEFGEPSYLVFLGDEGEVYYFSDTNNGKRRYYDEKGREILSEEMANFKKNCPKSFCIEVIDTAIAYPLGLRNGDIIISYGNWTLNKDLRTDLNYFYLETLLQQDENKKITLLRHHPETNTSEILTKKLGKGKPSDLGFYPHQIYYTAKESERLYLACKANNISLTDGELRNDTTVMMAVQMKGGFIQTKFYHWPNYDIKDPCFVLYAKEKSSTKDISWNILADNAEKWRTKDMFNSDFNGKTEIYLTQDFKSLKKIEKTSSGNRGMIILPVKVSMNVYNSLLRCYQSYEDSITGKKKSVSVVSPSLKIKEKQLIGKWQIFVTHDDDNIPVTLEFLKDGKVNFRAEAEMKDESMQVGFAITSQGGTWSLQNGCISFDFDNATNDCDITKLEMLGVDEEQRGAMETLLRVYLEREKEKLLEKFSLSQIFESDVFVITRATSKEFVIMDGEVERTFIKVK